MLGMADGLIALVWILCMGSALVGMGYGAIMWNKGDDDE